MWPDSHSCVSTTVKQRGSDYKKAGERNVDVRNSRNTCDFSFNNYDVPLGKSRRYSCNIYAGEVLSKNNRNTVTPNMYIKESNTKNNVTDDEVFVCPICLLTYPVSNLYEFCLHISEPGHDIKQITSLKRDDYYHCPKCCSKGVDVYDLLRHWHEGGAAHHGMKILKKIKRKVWGSGGGQVAAAAHAAISLYNRDKMLANDSSSSSFGNSADNISSSNISNTATSIYNSVKKSSINNNIKNNGLSSSEAAWMMSPSTCVDISNNFINGSDDTSYMNLPCRNILTQQCVKSSSKPFMHDFLSSLLVDKPEYASFIERSDINTNKMNSVDAVFSGNNGNFVDENELERAAGVRTSFNFGSIGNCFMQSNENVCGLPCEAINNSSSGLLEDSSFDANELKQLQSQLDILTPFQCKKKDEISFIPFLSKNPENNDIHGYSYPLSELLQVKSSVAAGGSVDGMGKEEESGAKEEILVQEADGKRASVSTAYPLSSFSSFTLPDISQNSQDFMYFSSFSSAFMPDLSEARSQYFNTDLYEKNNTMMMMNNQAVSDNKSDINYNQVLMDMEYMQHTLIESLSAALGKQKPTEENNFVSSLNCSNSFYGSILCEEKKKEEEEQKQQQQKQENAKKQKKLKALEMDDNENDDATAGAAHTNALVDNLLFEKTENLKEKTCCFSCSEFSFSLPSGKDVVFHALPPPPTLSFSQVCNLTTINIVVRYISTLEETFKAVDHLKTCFFIAVSASDKRAAALHEEQAEQEDLNFHMLQIANRLKDDEYECYVFDCESIGSEGFFYVLQLLTCTEVCKIMCDCRFIQHVLQNKFGSILSEVIDLQLAFDFLTSQIHSNVYDLLKYASAEYNVHFTGDFDQVSVRSDKKNETNSNKVIGVEKEKNKNEVEKKENLRWLDTINDIRNISFSLYTSSFNSLSLIEKTNFVRHAVDVYIAFVLLLPMFDNSELECLFKATKKRISSNLYDKKERHLVKFCEMNDFRMCNFELYDFLNKKAEASVSANCSLLHPSGFTSNIISHYFYMKNLEKENGENDLKVDGSAANVIKSTASSSSPLSSYLYRLIINDDMDVIMNVLPLPHKEILQKLSPYNKNRISSIEFEANSIPLIRFNVGHPCTMYLANYNDICSKKNVYVLKQAQIYDIFKQLMSLTEDLAEPIEDIFSDNRMKIKLGLLLDGSSECIYNTLHTFKVYQKNNTINQIILRIGRDIQNNSFILSDLLFNGYVYNTNNNRLFNYDEKKKKNNNMHSILIIGYSGSGKTTLLRDIVRALVLQDIPVAVFDCTGYFQNKHSSIFGVTIFNLHGSKNKESLTLTDVLKSTDFSCFKTVVIDRITTRDDVMRIRGLRRMGIRVIAGMTGTFNTLRKCKEFRELFGLDDELEGEIFCRNKVERENVEKSNNSDGCNFPFKRVVVESEINDVAERERYAQTNNLFLIKQAGNSLFRETFNPADSLHSSVSSYASHSMMSFAKGMKEDLVSFANSSPSCTQVNTNQKEGMKLFPLKEKEIVHTYASSSSLNEPEDENLFHCIIELADDDFNQCKVIIHARNAIRCIHNYDFYPLQLRQRNPNTGEIRVTYTDSSNVHKYGKIYDYYDYNNTSHTNNQNTLISTAHVFNSNQHESQ